MLNCGAYVVPYAGTWIETGHIKMNYLGSNRSFPTRERGLKPSNTPFLIVGDESFPTRERGLKLGVIFDREAAGYVVPYAGTWIETKYKITALC